MRALLTVLALLTGLGNAYANCNYDDHGKHHCYEDWGVQSDEGFPGWTSDVGSNKAEVQDSMGILSVDAGGPNHYLDNHAHMTWTDVGGGFDWVRISGTWFNGDRGNVGWIEKLSDGYSMCQPKTHAPRASDEALMLTLGDDGDSYVGGLLGGDLLAYGIVIPPFEQVPPQGYAVIGVVQKLAGQAPTVLAWTLGPPIRMGDVTRNLTVSLVKDATGWLLKAKGDEWGGPGSTWEAHAYIDGEPNLSAGVGLDAVTMPKSWCVYREGGSMSRQFVIGNIEAREH